MPTLHALYRTMDDAESTYRALVEAGIPVDDIGLLTAHGNEPAPASGDETASGAKTGAAIGGVMGGGTGVLAGLGSIAIPGFGPVVAAGWWAAVLAGVVGGAAAGAAAGGLVGRLVEAGLPEAEAERYAEGVRRGQIFVTVTVDAGKAPGAEALLAKYHPVAHDRL